LLRQQHDFSGKRGRVVVYMNWDVAEMFVELICG